jgi:integrase
MGPSADAESPPHFPSFRVSIGDSVSYRSAGLRQSNVLGLQWSRVDLAAGHAWVGADQSKNGKPVAVSLNATALEVLRRQLGKDPQRVFTYAGNPLATANTRAWRKALKRAGIENFRWHDTRHTWA